MCWCNPSIRTPCCGSAKCMQALEGFQKWKPSDHSMAIARKEKLQANIKEAVKELKQHQEQCDHPEDYLDENHGGNTGNFDPSSDCYWVDYDCACCGKQWREYYDS